VITYNVKHKTSDKSFKNIFVLHVTTALDVPSISGLPVDLDNGAVLNAAQYLADRLIGVALQQENK